MKQELVDAEYQRLKDLFKDVDELTLKLIDGLLQNAAFLKVKLDVLQIKLKNKGVTQKNKGDKTVKTGQRFKTYLVTLSSYQQIIKAINSIVGKRSDDGDDEFDEFMKNVKGV